MSFAWILATWHLGWVLTACSFFGEQEGDFELHLFSISAFKHVPYETDSVDGDEKQHLKGPYGGSEESVGKEKWWKSLLCGLV